MRTTIDQLPLLPATSVAPAEDRTLIWDSSETIGRKTKAILISQLVQLLAGLLPPSNMEAQPLDPDLSAIAALVTASFGRSLLTLTSAAELRAILMPPSTMLPYSVSQSSTAYGHTGTYSSLSDNNSTTGAGTAGGSSEWIQADLGSIRWVESYGLAGGVLANGWNGTAQYLRAALLEVSTNAAVWVRVRDSQPDITDSNGLNLFSLNGYTRYLRFRKSSWLGMSALHIYGA